MSKMSWVVAVIAGMTTTCAGVAMAAETEQPAAGYHAVRKVKAGGEGRWDFVTVDSAAHRLFVPRSTHVMVLDLADAALKQVGDISGTAGVHGVALAPELGRGFTSDGQNGSVTIFDYKTLKVLGSVKAGEGPDAILFDPASRQVFVMNHRGGTVTAFPADIDPAKPAGVTTITVGGALECAAVDGAGHLFVNVEDKSQTVAIDLKTLTVTDRWSLGEGDGPTGLAIDPGKGLLFATCGNEKLVVLDDHTGKIVATLPIGKGADGCAFDSQRGLAFASCGDGTVVVVSDADPAHPSVVQTVKTMQGARTVDLDAATHRLYLPAAEFAPAPEGQKNARPQMLPGGFTIVVVG